MTFSLCSITSLFVYVHSTIGVAKISLVPRKNTQSSVSWCNLAGVSTVVMEMSMIHCISSGKQDPTLDTCLIDGANTSCHQLLLHIAFAPVGRYNAHTQHTRLWTVQNWSHHAYGVGCYSICLKPGLFSICVFVAHRRRLAAVPVQRTGARRKPYMLIFSLMNYCAHLPW